MNFLTQLSFPFRLETDLPADGALVITSPIDLGTSGLLAKQQMHLPDECTEDLWENAEIMFATNLPPFTYMVNFGKPIKNSVWHTVRLTIPTALEAQVVSKPFAVYTTTVYDDIADGVVLDDNMVFGVIEVVDVPSVNEQISVRLEGIQMEKVGATEILQIDFQPEKDYGARVLIILDDDFLVTSLNACRFIENTNLESIVPPLGTYSCSAYENDYHKVLVTLDESFTLNKAYTL